MNLEQAPLERVLRRRRIRRMLMVSAFALATWVAAVVTFVLLEGLISYLVRSPPMLQPAPWLSLRWMANALLGQWAFLNGVPGGHAIGVHALCALPCAALSSVLMAPAIGRWSDPAPWRALRSSCLALGMLFAALVWFPALVAWDVPCGMWGQRHANSLLTENGVLAPWMLLVPPSLWLLRRLDETDDLLGLDRHVRRLAMGMTALTLACATTAVSLPVGSSCFSPYWCAGPQLFSFVGTMTVLLGLDLALLRLSRRSRERRMRLMVDLCPNCGYPRPAAPRCPECGMMRPPASLRA